MAVALSENASKQVRQLKQSQNLPENVFLRMGVKGGYALARAPEAISMADIVRSLEGSLAPVSCLAEGGGPGECTHADTPCSAHAFWEQLQETITSTLESVSVADLMKEGQPA